MHIESFIWSYNNNNNNHDHYRDKEKSYLHVYNNISFSSLKDSVWSSSRKNKVHWSYLLSKTFLFFVSISCLRWESILLLMLMMIAMIMIMIYSFRSLLSFFFFYIQRVYSLWQWLVISRDMHKTTDSFSFTYIIGTAK